VLRLILKNCVKSFNLMKVIGTHQSANFSISTFKSDNFSDTANCSETKKPRYADEMIRLSSVRYKPEKVYTKQCPDCKPICNRTQFLSCDLTLKCPCMCYEEQSTS